MKCFIWTDEASYTAFAHCENVTEARRMLRDEIGGYDGSCPERKKAREAVEEMTPAIYVGRIAGFRLSDSAEVRELEQYQDKLTAERDQLRAELAAAKNLLARIHRDGGHHTEAVGVINSITDAHEKWSELLLENFNLTNELATARETIASAQEEIAAMCTERNATATEGDVVFKIQEAQRYGKG